MGGTEREEIARDIADFFQRVHGIYQSRAEEFAGITLGAATSSSPARPVSIEQARAMRDELLADPRYQEALRRG